MSAEQRESVVRAAEKYLFDGLVKHEPDGIPFHPDVWRKEQGNNTGRSADEIRKSLVSDIMMVITGIRDVNWIVDGEQAVAFYDLYVKTGPDPVRIAERFRVVDGLITEIEAIFTPPAAPTTQPATPTE